MDQGRADKHRDDGHHLAERDQQSDGGQRDGEPVREIEVQVRHDQAGAEADEKLAERQAPDDLPFPLLGCGGRRFGSLRRRRGGSGLRLPGGPLALLHQQQRQEGREAGCAADEQHRLEADNLAPAERLQDVGQIAAAHAPQHLCGQHHRGMVAEQLQTLLLRRIFRQERNRDYLEKGCEYAGKDGQHLQAQRGFGEGAQHEADARHQRAGNQNPLAAGAVSKQSDRDEQDCRRQGLHADDGPVHLIVIAERLHI